MAFPTDSTSSTCLDLAHLFLRCDHQNEAPGTFLVSPPSRFQKSWSDTFVWRRQAAGHWLAREWRHWTNNDERNVRAWHPTPCLNTSISVQSTIVIDYWTWQDQRASARWRRSCVFMCRVEVRHCSLAHACYDDPPTLKRCFILDGNTMCLEPNQVVPR